MFGFGKKRKPEEPVEEERTDEEMCLETTHEIVFRIQSAKSREELISAGHELNQIIDTALDLRVPSMCLTNMTTMVAQGKAFACMSDDRNRGVDTLLAERCSILDRAYYRLESSH